MRVLHLVHQYAPEHVGGTELYAQTLAQAQTRRGDEVAVFTPSSLSTSNDLDITDENGLTVYRMPVGQRSSTAVFRSTFGNSRLVAGLTETLDHFQPEIVHIQHLMGLPVEIVDQLVARQIPFVVALHDYWYGCANAQLLTNTDQTICAGPDEQATNCAHCALARAGLPSAAVVLAPVLAPVMRRRNALLARVFAAASLVIAPNEFVRSTYAAMGLPVNQVVVLPWGMDLPPDLPEIRRAAELARADRPPGELHLGYVGSLSHQKGIHVLVEAFNRLPAGEARLDIYGNPAVFPEYSAELERKATHPGIRFAGLLPREAVWDRLASFDALVLPTLWYEASPLTIDESFAAGTPVIGSSIGALPTMIRDGVDGLLFPPGDVDTLAGILQALQTSPQRVSVLRSAIRPVKTMDTHAAEIAAYYSQILDALPPAR